jgi:hypothetical protein
VPWVYENKEWLVEEYLLTLPVLDIVFNEVLIAITSVPLLKDWGSNLYL